MRINCSHSQKCRKQLRIKLRNCLADWSNGDPIALEQLIPLVYDKLRRMAQRYMRRQPSGHTFQTTELIHEAYLKLAAGAENKNWENRAHFFGVAAQARPSNQHLI